MQIKILPHQKYELSKSLDSDVQNIMPKREF